MSADVIYIPEAAKRLGKTETALRAMLQRGSKNAPAAIKVGIKWAFERKEFDRFIKRRKDGGARNT